MNAPPPTLPGSPLPPAAHATLQALAGTLGSAELQWASGYLAGYAAALGNRGTAAAPQSAAATLTVLFGSQSGNARRLATDLMHQAEARGLPVRSINMLDYKPAQLRSETHLLVLVSTHGEGDPPDAALELYEHLHGRKAPALPGLNFAVLALGDSSYEHYCKTGRDFDAVLEKLGGKRIHARADCDVDFAEPAGAWINTTLDAVQAAMRLAAPAAAPKPAVVGTSTTTRERPFAATVLENLCLTGRGSGKETRHIELSLAGSGIHYEAGDALGVLPANPVPLVAEIIERLHLDANAPVTVGRDPAPLVQALTERVEITTLTAAFLAGWAEISGAQRLRELLADEDGQALSAYLGSCQIIDVLTEFPVTGLAEEDFVRLLRRLPPRLYSLASSLKACPEEAHLTVARVRYAAHGRAREGVASGWLAGRAPDATVPVYIQDNPEFRLPADPATPVIMIGPGTGVAPFRAFLQDREATGATGRNWLFFGEQHFRTDFLYQTEWQRYRKDGLLTCLDVAFSRDQTQKVYVQHRMHARAQELWAWLEEGAHLYVCGDAKHMADDVHRALAAIVMQAGGRDREQADTYLRDLQRARRYQRDVY